MIRTPPTTALNTYYVAVTTVPNAHLAPCLMRLAVSSRYGSASYLLLFAASAVPNDGAVPIAEPIPIAANGTALRTWQPQGLPINSPGLTIVASSTAATLTKDTSATLDFEVDVEEWETQNPNASTAGDLSSGVGFLQVWSEAAGLADPKRLLRLQITNLQAAVGYLVAYAVDTPSASSKPFLLATLAANESRELNFGMNEGFQPVEQAADGSNAIGCTICYQTATAAHAKVVAANMYCKAAYIEN